MSALTVTQEVQEVSDLSVTQDTSQEVMITVLNERMMALEHKIKERGEELSALRKENNESLKQIIAEISAIREDRPVFIKIPQTIKSIIFGVVAFVSGVWEFIKQLFAFVSLSCKRAREIFLNTFSKIGYSSKKDSRKGST